MSRKRAAKASYQHNVYQLEQALQNNAKAYGEGPKRKAWSKHDLKSVKPLTQMQYDMFHDFMEGQNICAHGSAGTGKTFVAIYLALNDILSQHSDTDKIIIVRSAVQGREIGHLPGTIEEKSAAYEKPYVNIFADLLGRPNTYQDMKEAGKVEFETTSFLRGITWDNAVIVVDEAQNMDWEEINTIMTRLGKNSRIIVVGDLPQCDLKKKNDKTGLPDLIVVANAMTQFSVLKFTREDIVRSGFVKAWICASEDAGFA